jgi:cytochrome c553
MNRKILMLLMVALASATGIAMAATDTGEPPAWAYPVTPPAPPAAPDDGTLRRVPDSTLGFTLAQMSDRFFAPDWHPGDHPAMPEVVAHGRKPEVYACGYCHRADGPGGPENASLAGLPEAYIVQQVADFRSGARTSSLLTNAPKLMTVLSKAINDDEVAAAAKYFSGLKPRAVISVVEASVVPKTFVTLGHLAVLKDGGTEPIGDRIIEVPADLELFVSRDSRARFIAYVPIGSVARGKALAASGGGKTLPCGSCHGPDLKGVGVIPGIAGRSPSNTFRQLYDIQHGARAGEGNAPMKPVVEKLTGDDMLEVAAYLASLAP